MNIENKKRFIGFTNFTHIKTYPCPKTSFLAQTLSDSNSDVLSSWQSRVDREQFGLRLESTWINTFGNLEKYIIPLGTKTPPVGDNPGKVLSGWQSWVYRERFGLRIELTWINTISNLEKYIFDKWQIHVQLATILETYCQVDRAKFTESNQSGHRPPSLCVGM